VNVWPGQKESEESTEDETKGDLEPADGQVLAFAKAMNPQKELVAHQALDEIPDQVEESDAMPD
jgi:hypothetical protein